MLTGAEELAVPARTEHTCATSQKKAAANFIRTGQLLIQGGVSRYAVREYVNHDNAVQVLCGER